MRHQRATPDPFVAKVAARQYGVVSVRQLRAAGLDKFMVRHRVGTGHLHPIHRGVYAVGHSHLSQEAKWMAAALACGEAAVLSHRSAASLWAMLPAREGSDVDVSIPGDGGRRRRAGIRLHRCPSLTSSHVTRRRGIPVTTPERTASDLRRAIPSQELRRAIRQAEILGLPIGLNAVPDRTRSELEFLFLQLCRRYELPVPDVNVRVGSLVVDFLWHGKHLIVETDGYRYHRGRIAFEKDRSRDLELRALGYGVIRLTHDQVVNRPEEASTAVRQALSR